MKTKKIPRYYVLIFQDDNKEWKVGDIDNPEKGIFKINRKELIEKARAGKIEVVNYKFDKLGRFISETNTPIDIIKIAWDHNWN